MAESFATVCNMLLKFHDLPAKFANHFNDYIIHQTRKISTFYLKHSDQDAQSLILLILSDVTNFIIISLLVGFLK